MPIVDVVERDGCLGEYTEVFRVRLTEALRGVKRVDEVRCTSVNAVAKTVEDLEARRVRKVEEVHVQPKVDVRVRDVLAVRHVLHVPRLPVERLADLAKARREGAQLAGIIGGALRGDIGHKKQPVEHELGDRGEEPSRCLQTCIRQEEIAH